MRGFVRACSRLFALILLTASAFSQDRQFVITEGADYFGADYDIRQDVDLSACEAACGDDTQCRAFTYNSAARWCFLKAEVGELRAVAGAISGRIVTTAEPSIDVEAERISELVFLPQAFIDEARRFAGRLSEAPSAGIGPDDAIIGARDAVAENDYWRANELYGVALRFWPERFELWTALTDTAIRASSDDWQVQQRLTEERTSGAVNAYLRAVTPDERATALRQLGWSLADRYEWKPAIRAYRASLALVEDEATRSTYDAIVAEHGFRIVGHDVEADAAAPRICVNLSDRLAEDRNVADYVSVEGGANLAIEAGGQQICIDGVAHGSRYRVTARAGLPAADGESLSTSVTLEIFVRDRSPSVRFLGDAYVLPAGGEPTIPVVTVNTRRVDATLYRIGDRQLADAIADNTFLSQLSAWEAEAIEERSGAKVWNGSVDVASEINREMTTAIPVGALEADLQPGAYVLTARAVNDTSNEWDARATQWFVVTDLGLTTLAGNDGLHVMVRSLGDAGPVGDVALRLVAVNNEILGATVSDAQGYALFAPGLMRGTGGMAPALLVAETAAGDYSFLDLSKAAMDLTDRGVDGREPPQPLDVFLTTERGIYRAGETVHATALVRDAKADAVSNVPLTAILTRPDGKEARRVTLVDQGLGGSVTPFELTADAMRGTWRVAIHADAKAAALAETAFLVEDFRPERLDFDLTTDVDAVDPAEPTALGVEARFLYGAPAAELSVEGETQLAAGRALQSYPGYVFGLADEAFNALREPLSSATTDDTGHAALAAVLPAAIVSSRPLEATVNVRVLDPGGRPVERSLSLPVRAMSDRLGIKPLFDGAAGENGPVAFELIAVDAEGTRVAATGLNWSLYQLKTEFQWYRADGRWNYERIETKTRVANGSADIAADAPTRVDAAVEWGSYRLEVDTPNAAALPVSFDFEAGWHVEAKALETPEALKVSLDKDRYRPGETARVHLETRFDGIALVMVVDDRLIASQPVVVAGNQADIDLPVTREWGPGAYVTAVLYRPMDLAAKRMPGRAVGLSWTAVDPGARDLDVMIDAPNAMRPRGDMPVTLTLEGLPAGEEAYVTLAAIDVGILNLTGHETPDPESYYFGQRRLGMAIRDIYNQLIDRMQGVRGVVRSGGDASFVDFNGEAPTETLIAYHSGVVTVGTDGTAAFDVPIPDFNGTVRLMAMAWTAAGVGHAERDVLVRDPVVIAASLPHFLAPGDRSRLALDLASVEGVTGTATLAIRSAAGRVAVNGQAERRVELQPGKRTQVLVPISAMSVGSDALIIALTLPDGTVLEKSVAIDIRLNEPPVATTDFIALPPGGELSLTAARFEGLIPGTASLDVSASGAERLNVAAILRKLDRYPYGCTEQITSRAMPLVYLNDVAVSAGLANDPAIRERVEKAIAGVLANQSASGGFGLWSPDGRDDLWLSAYVADFLTRAQQSGYAVPSEALQLALDNLKNRLAYAGDFQQGGEDIAYALYVLAANGRAAIGDLRYYAEAKLDAFATPLAKAQIGAALALYGEKPRADAVFRRALGDLPEYEASSGWRSDYGTPLRDGAAILTLASEARATIDLASLSRRIADGRMSARHTSTQEDAWSLLAAHALMQGVSAPRLSVDGAAISGPLLRTFDAEHLAASPLVIANNGEQRVEVGVTVRGVPAEPEPAGGTLYSLTRSYYTLDGERADLSAVAQGARLVAVLDVTSGETAGARLILDDPLPAGFEIDNPHILASGEVAALDWLTLSESPGHVEFRGDRFIAAWDTEAGGASDYRFAYVVRATAPGTFRQPAALVEDMYRPELRARTASGVVEIVGPLR